MIKSKYFRGNSPLPVIPRARQNLLEVDMSLSTELFSVQAEAKQVQFIKWNNCRVLSL